VTTSSGWLSSAGLSDKVFIDFQPPNDAPVSIHFFFFGGGGGAFGGTYPSVVRPRFGLGLGLDGSFGIGPHLFRGGGGGGALGGTYPPFRGFLDGAGRCGGAGGFVI
jgi:hypothetical protein